jgi:hypothetical protein
MSELLDLIFSNIAFVILILGGIYSFFKRNAAQQEKANPPVQRRFNQPKVEEVETFNHNTPDRRESTRTARTIETQEQPRSMERAERNEVRERQSESVRNFRNKKSVVSTTKQRKKLVSNSPDHIIQGVIWSEILGSPKAKAPHLSQRNNRI